MLQTLRGMPVPITTKQNLGRINVTETSGDGVRRCTSKGRNYCILK